MFSTRIIPLLLLSNDGLVKGVNFKNHRYIGDPINAVQIFNEMEVDELLFLDIAATMQKKGPSLNIIKKIANQCMMPFGVGGGIRTTEKIREILSAGAEKVCLNTEALENPDIVKKASKIFGSQSIMISIDYRRLKGKYEVYSRCGSKLISSNILETVKLMEKYGAGEILLNSIDNDGTMKGYDIETIKIVSESVNIPVIACGGAGCLKDLKKALDLGEASAIAAGSLFVFHGPRRAVLINYPNHLEIKKIKNK
ncbi:MAG: AglZ/HisF2 family acetamidino modification protein [Cyanobacteria bacterium]|nr:AglZ/HisF2 family acetamidino modification protein [Cyanobacteriota bacterium]